MSPRRPPTDLPVEEVLTPLRAALASDGLVVLQAPPGAGKTTVVPLDLLEAGTLAPDRRLVLLEPRRVAARAAARRLASQLGEDLGSTVGLSTRDERRVSRRTCIEVVTEGVLLRRLQRDPELAGTGTLFFDEFHERNLEADLALAFALEAREAVRSDLRILVASATLDGARVARLLGGAPIVEAAGRTHPVEVEHRPRPDRRELPAAVATATIEVLGRHGGDVLVFLPGAAEIRRTARALASGVSSSTVVLPLYGALPPEEQDRALAPDPQGRTKVVLATDLAESSLTIEGVRAVVDAGLAREPRFDAATEMTGLVTVPASRASATQRAGRAGRTGPGLALRLWPAREHPGRDPHPRPAIVTDDLTGAALEVASWGADVAALRLLDQPPDAAWSRARATLRELGALDDQGRITRHGRLLADLPVHPRLGHLLVRGRELGLGRLACDVAAVLEDRDLLLADPEQPSADLTVRVRVLRGGSAPGRARVRRGTLARARRESQRLARLLDVPGTEAPATGAPGTEAPGGEDRVGALLALGWPDRIAGAREHRRGAYLLAGGRGAVVDERDPLASEPWLVAATVDRGRSDARIHLAAPVSPVELRELLPQRVTWTSEIGWVDGDVVAEGREELGALVLARRPLPDPDPELVLAALLDGLRTEGLDLLRWRREDRELQARLAVLHDHLGPPWPDVSDAGLTARLEEVVGPFLLGARRRADLARIDAGDLLRSQLPAGLAGELDRLAPTHLPVPSGSRVRVDYRAGERPVLAVRVQELFGATTTPTVLDGRLPVLVHLLSPARRPVQVTDDLAGFWERTYPSVRAELRGRYPKHAWPEDPTTATPLRGTPRRRR
jgi:ATP-dependent helicase HrpB